MESGYNPIEVTEAIEIVAENAKPEYTSGDVNHDSKVYLVNAAIMLRHIAGWDNIEIDIELADMDSDDSVGLTDVQLVLRQIFDR